MDFHVRLRLYSFSLRVTVWHFKESKLVLEPEGIALLIRVHALDILIPTCSYLGGSVTLEVAGLT